MFVINKEGFYFDLDIKVRKSVIEQLVNSGCIICNEALAMKLTHVDADEWYPIDIRVESGVIVCDALGSMPVVVTDIAEYISNFEL